MIPACLRKPPKPKLQSSGLSHHQDPPVDGFILRQARPTFMEVTGTIGPAIHGEISHVTRAQRGLTSPNS